MTLPKKTLLRKCREDNLILGTMMSVVFAITACGILFNLNLLNWQNVLTTIVVTVIGWVAICYPAAYFIRMIAREKINGHRTIKIGTIAAIVGVAVLLLLINIKFVVGDMYGRNEFLYVLGNSYLNCDWDCELGTKNYPLAAEEKIRAQIDDAYTLVFWLTLGAAMTVGAQIIFETWRKSDDNPKPVRESPPQYEPGS
jgi:hypothetical protein